MKTKKVYILFAAVLVACLLLPVASSAVTISPPIIELNASKGDVINQSLKVRNESTRAAIYYLSSEKFVAAGEGGTPQFVTSGEDVDLASWIKFPSDSITIPAGATVEVPFTITVPSYAGPGGHYAAIFLSTVPPKATAGGSSVSIASKIGSLILVKIAGEIKESAELTEFSTGAKSYSSLPVDFSIRVNNTGNVHLKPMGTITVKNMFGSIAGKVAVNNNGGNVLPGQTRKYDAQWVKNPNATGSKTFWGKYRDQRENYAFGKYTADLVLAYGTAGLTLAGSTSFWVIPWNIILVNLLIVIIVVVILYFVIKKYNAWLLSKYANKNKK
jgi:hypothetical protein